MNSPVLYVYWPLMCFGLAFYEFLEYKYGFGLLGSIFKNNQLSLLFIIIFLSVGIGGTILMLPTWWQLFWQR